MSNSRYVLPSFEEKTAYGTRTIDPYSKLFQERIVFLASPIDSVSSNDIMSQLLILNHIDNEAPINLYINSPGGEFEDMTAIYDTIKFISAPVHTLCLGKAEGVAAILLAAGAKGNRVLLPNAKVVLSQPVSYKGNRGQASDITIEANEIVKTRRWIEKTLSTITGQSEDKVKTDIEREYHLTAEKAVEYGLADSLALQNSN